MCLKPQTSVNLSNAILFSLLSCFEVIRLNLTKILTYITDRGQWNFTLKLLPSEFISTSNSMDFDLNLDISDMVFVKWT